VTGAGTLIRHWPFLSWLLAAIAVAGSAVAHEVRPAYLEIDERADGSARVLWRQPIAGEYALSLQPVLSGGALDAAPSHEWLTMDSRTRVWDLLPHREPMAGQTLRVAGLEHSITDVLVRLRTAGGTETTLLLRPLSPELVIAATSVAGPIVPGYFRLGLEHIFSGWDHLLYVAGLLLLVGGWRRLLATITAFTVAHSLTLAAASLGLVRLDPTVVEALIALSILYVAVELAQRARGRAGVAVHWPWLVTFGFGLLHGFGFAGALQAVGVPRDALVPALLSFNLGIEAGQLLFAGAVLTLLAGLARSSAGGSARVRRHAPTVIGGIAAFWLIERVVAFGAS
jgi:HupE / UreJ protein